MKKFSKRQQGGFTLVELAIVIAIIVVAIVGIVAKIQSVRLTQQVSAEGANLNAIMGKVQSTFAGRANYAGVSTALLLAQSGFPTQMVNGTTVTNVWGGGVTVAPGTGNTTVDIAYAGVPTNACIELVSSASRQYNEVTVGTTATKAGAAVSSLATAQTACSAAATVTVTFNAS